MCTSRARATTGRDRRQRQDFLHPVLLTVSCSHSCNAHAHAHARAHALTLPQVSLTFDQARVAELVGRVLAEKGTLTCAHTAQALQASQGLSRQLVLKALAPLCVDLESDGALIVSVLTEWERVLARDIPGLVVA